MVYSDYPLYEERTAHILHRVFGWMSAALAITAAISFYLLKSPMVFKAVVAYIWPLLILQLIIVIGLSFLIQRIPFVLAAVLFVLYAASVGVTITGLLYAYQQASVYTAFLVAAGMFAAMSIYGYTTRADLTAIGNISMMVLFGMIIAMLVNMFLQNNALAYVLSVIGVIVFSLLTAFDIQKIKELSQRLMTDRETSNKIALIGALTLYLDFINLFISLLQMMGKRNE